MTLEQVWTFKYRPRTIEEMLLSDENKKYFQALTSIPNNLLFTGEPGSGKTALAKILANKFSPESYLYINASEQGTIDVLRDRIQQFIEVSSIDGSPKTVILDEVDGSSVVFQQALRVVLEENLDFVKFILTGNYRNKITEAIRSRCQEYQFVVSEQEILKRIVYILRTENIKIDKSQVDNLKEIVKSYYPDIRKTINEIQRFSQGGEFKFSKREDSTISKDIKSKLKNKEDVFSIRKFVVENTDKFSNDYHSLMRNLFDLYVADCNTIGTLLVSEYMYRHAFVADTEVNFSALLFNLSQKL